MEIFAEVISILEETYMYCLEIINRFLVFIGQEPIVIDK